MSEKKEKTLHHGKIEFGFMATSDREAQRIVREIKDYVQANCEEVDNISGFRQVKQWREVICPHGWREE
uniref:Uncharacterized protein n=1 Tax=viral metagenome TaxID=1070528 RepID=A0A6M3X5S9_9ZZZZ